MSGYKKLSSILTCYLVIIVALAIIPGGSRIVTGMNISSQFEELASTEAVVVEGTNYSVSNNTMSVGGTLVLTLVIGFGLLFLGMRPGEGHWAFLSGFVWIFCSITVLLDYGAGWMVIGLGMGLTVIIKQALEYTRNEQ